MTNFTNSVTAVYVLLSTNFGHTCFLQNSGFLANKTRSNLGNLIGTTRGQCTKFNDLVEN